MIKAAATPVVASIKRTVVQDVELAKFNRIADCDQRGLTTIL